MHLGRDCREIQFSSHSVCSESRHEYTVCFSSTYTLKLNKEKKMGRNNCLCLWNLNANKHRRLINFNYFWSKVSYDVCGISERRKDLSQQICQMYLPRNLILTTNCEENNYIFTIGIVPIKKFEVVMRLELENTGVYIEMGIPEARRLFSLLHQTFQANLMHPSVFATAAAAEPKGYMTRVNLELFHHNSYKLCVGDKQIIISIDSLSKLMENEHCIKLLMNTYEIKATLCGNTVFKLLNICCQHLRNANRPKKYFASDISTNSGIDDVIILRQNNRDLTKKINLSEILDELMCSPCDCLSTTFIIETKVHFQNLISVWIGAYYETQLLSEAVRLDTFKRNWPHKFIETQTLAQSGFFYVGPFDRVQCIFCKTVLEKWQPNDTVLSEHKRFAPFCSSSLDRAANNIPLEPLAEFEKLWSKEEKKDVEGYNGRKSNPLKKFINGLI